MDQNRSELTPFEEEKNVYREIFREYALFAAFKGESDFAKEACLIGGSSVKEFLQKEQEKVSRLPIAASPEESMSSEKKIKVIKKCFRSCLRDELAADESVENVAIVCGPPGSGKSSFFQKSELGKKLLAQPKTLIVDATMATEIEDWKKFFDGLKTSNKKCEMLVVFCEPENAVVRVMDRALKDGRSRNVNARRYLNPYFYCGHLAKVFKIPMTLYDNNTAAGKVSEQDAEERLTAFLRKYISDADLSERIDRKGEYQRAVRALDETLTDIVYKKMQTDRRYASPLVKDEGAVQGALKSRSFSQPALALASLNSSKDRPDASHPPSRSESGLSLKISSANSFSR